MGNEAAQRRAGCSDTSRLRSFRLSFLVAITSVMWWIYALAFSLMVVNTAIVLWLIKQENDAADSGSSWFRRPHRGPIPPPPYTDRPPVARQANPSSRRLRAFRRA